MARARRGVERSSQIATSEENLEMEEVDRATEAFMELLSPLEGYIMTLQSLLVWEKPLYSAGLLLSVNVVFWFVDLLDRVTCSFNTFMTNDCLVVKST